MPDRNARGLQLSGKGLQRGRVGDLEAEIAFAVGQRAIHHQPLRAIIHPKGASRVAALDHLHAKPVGGECRPIRQVRRAYTHIAQSTNFHGGASCSRRISATAASELIAAAITRAMAGT